MEVSAHHAVPSAAAQSEYERVRAEKEAECPDSDAIIARYVAQLDLAKSAEIKRRASDYSIGWGWTGTVAGFTSSLFLFSTANLLVIGTIALGTFAGTRHGQNRARLKISSTPDYIQWKTRYIEKNTFDHFVGKINSEYSGEEAFDPFLDPSTQEIPADPVKAPCGHVFSRTEITKWLDRTLPEIESNMAKIRKQLDALNLPAEKRAELEKDLENEPKRACPHRCRHFRANELIGAEDFVAEVNKTLSVVMKKPKDVGAQRPPSPFYAKPFIGAYQLTSNVLSLGANVTLDLLDAIVARPSSGVDEVSVAQRNYDDHGYFSRELEHYSGW